MRGGGQQCSKIVSRDITSLHLLAPRLTDSLENRLSPGSFFSAWRRWTRHESSSRQQQRDRAPPGHRTLSLFLSADCDRSANGRLLKSLCCDCARRQEPNRFEVPDAQAQSHMDATRSKLERTARILEDRQTFMCPCSSRCNRRGALAKHIQCKRTVIPTSDDENK